MSMKWIASGFTALGLAALSAAAPDAAPWVAQAGGGAKAGPALEFESGEKGIEVADLLEQAKAVTGEEFFFDPRELRDARVTFSGKMTVPREKFLSFLDWCLHETGFVDSERVVAGLHVHSIAKLGQGGGRSIQALKTTARVVERAELDAMSDRFTLVTTTYLCKNLPAREVVTTLQLYFADSATEAIRNTEGTDQIVMTGFAPCLAAVCTMLDRLDAVPGPGQGLVKIQELAKRVVALEAQVAALVKQSQAKEKSEDSGKR